jgi:glycosyltransferase involved in cell wall biosynthesis
LADDADPRSAGSPPAQADPRSAGSPPRQAGRPFRVVFLAPEWPPDRSANGVVSYVGAMREGLAACGAESRVVSSGVPPDMRGDDVVDLDDTRPGALAALALRALARFRPELAAARGAGASLAAALGALHARWPFDVVELEETWGFGLAACRARAFPTLARLHGPWFLNGAALGAPRDAVFAERDARERRFVARAGGVSAPSADVLARVRAHFALPLAAARVFPNPVRDPAPEACWCSRADEPPAVLFVGRFDRHKGGDLAIDAFRAIGAAHPRVELWFAGPDRGLADGRGATIGLAAYLAERIPDAAVRARVKVLGAQPRAEVDALRRRARVVLVPSRYEVFGMTAAETLAAGAPLVAADIGAFREMARSGEEALLVPPDDAGALARAALELLASPDRAASLGAAGRKRFEASYAPRAVAATALAFYRDAAARHAGGAG